MKSTIKVIEGPNGKKILLGSAFTGVHLTVREAEVAQLLGDHKYREIGEKMAISRRTVEYYSTNIKKKLRCASKREVVMCLQEAGILEQLKEQIGISHRQAKNEPAKKAPDPAEERKKADNDDLTVF